ncbi:MAG TPA: SMP-30/gluconolactonase/LRE family protein [Methylomirabilota bacterium]|nr:SMP-30/gluconolactonase/LRE family protein [Methylomirabilota bacterium]
MRTLSSCALCEGFCFLEAPRIHESGLLVSDVYGDAVYLIDANGTAAKMVDVPGHPSGLGRLPSGTWLVVVMLEKRLARFGNGARLESHTDLAPYVRYGPNDMVVDRRGRCYVGSFGFDRDGGESPQSTDLLLVEAPGEVRIVATDLWFPNGIAITPDGRLVVAESYANRLTSFDIESDGSLSNRRTFARVKGGPDGICADQGGGVWVSCFLGEQFVRVIEGGAITDCVPVPGRKAVACNLGGDDLRTLFILTAETTLEGLAQGRSSSRVDLVRVEVPGAESP